MSNDREFNSSLAKSSQCCHQHLQGEDSQLQRNNNNQNTIHQVMSSQVMQSKRQIVRSQAEQGVLSPDQKKT